MIRIVHVGVGHDDLDDAGGSHEEPDAKDEDKQAVEDHDDASSARLDVGLRVSDATADEGPKERHLSRRN